MLLDPGSEPVRAEEVIIDENAGAIAKIPQLIIVSDIRGSIWPAHFQEKNKQTDGGRPKAR